MTTPKKRQTPEAPATKLNLRQYWDEVGTENIEKIIDGLRKDDPECKASMAYFRLLRYGIKKPSTAYALRIIDLARQITPGFEPDLELLVRGVPRSKSGKGGAHRIQPSERFLAAQGA